MRIKSYWASVTWIYWFVFRFLIYIADEDLRVETSGISKFMLLTFNKTLFSYVVCVLCSIFPYASNFETVVTNLCVSLQWNSGSTKENYVYIVPLPYFHGRHGDKVLDKSKLSQFRVSNSKGVSVFCTTPLEEKYLRLFVAAKNKLYMWMWKHTADSVPKALSEQKIMDSLQMHRVSCQANYIYVHGTEFIITFMSIASRNYRKWQLPPAMLTFFHYTSNP